LVLIRGVSRHDRRSASHSGTKKGIDKAIKSAMQKFHLEMEGVYSTCILPETLDERPSAYRDAEIIRNSIGETAWKYFREFPEGNHFMMNNEPMMHQINMAYSEYPSADTHTGFTHSYLMRLVEKIAKEGIDAFANSKITYAQSNLPTIIEERQKRQQWLQPIAE
jgi:hypothetical protein